MAPLEVIDVGRDALWVLLKISTPVLLVALVVGLVIALFQALTQIQDLTLTFVPKIIAIFLTIMAILPFMFTTLSDFNERIHEKIHVVEKQDEGP